MKRIIKILSLSLLIAIGLSSCQAGGSDNPKAVLKSFFELLAKQDIKGAAKLATKDSKSTLDMVKKGMDMAKKMDTISKEDPMNEFKDAEFGEPTIKGDSAFVTVSSKANKQVPAEFTLVKEEGKWKVDFTMATLMKMGTKTMQQPGALDSVNPADLEQAQKTADSVLKNMDPKQLEELQKNMEKLK